MSSSGLSFFPCHGDTFLAGGFGGDSRGDSGVLLRRVWFWRAIRFWRVRIWRVVWWVVLAGDSGGWFWLGAVWWWFWRVILGVAGVVLAGVRHRVR
jgi:hypothetical protein